MTTGKRFAKLAGPLGMPDQNGATSIQRTADGPAGLPLPQEVRLAIATALRELPPPESFSRHLLRAQLAVDASLVPDLWGAALAALADG